MEVLVETVITVYLVAALATTIFLSWRLPGQPTIRILLSGLTWPLSVVLLIPFCVQLLRRGSDARR